jgi:primary-amine oxidase
MCLFERPTGTPSWRHAGGDLGLATVGAAGGTELVVRSISTVGNYDYLVDAVFGLEGSIRFDVAAAGVVLQRTVDAPDQAAFEASGEHQHGTLVGPNLVGVNHDHFINFRLDLDVGGPANRFVDRQLTTATVAGDEGRTSVWQPSDQVIGVEGPVAVPGTPGSNVWRVEAATPNSLGQRPAYVIDPLGAIATPLVAADDPGLARAPWSANPLWVTAYDATQVFAGGRTLPNGGAPEDGLPVWVGAQRPIVDVDLVTWFTVGFHHIVRSEDLPTMPIHRASFEIRPENVFPANPLLGFEAAPG